MTQTLLPAGPLVDAAWLRDHLNDIIVLDASVDRRIAPEGHAVFASGHGVFGTAHIPGARFADLFDGFSDPSGAFAFTAPQPHQLEAAARAVGIDDGSDVVVYDQLGDAWAARIWFVLRAFGFERVRVLAGGISAWQGIGGKVENGVAKAVSPGNFSSGPLQPWFVDTAAVRAIATADPDPKRPLISGLREALFQKAHIPGSLSLPWPELRDASGAVDPANVRKRLDLLGIWNGSEPVLYCGGGINAAGLALAMAAAGLPMPRLYDDSLNGWQAAGLPVVEGEGIKFTSGAAQAAGVPAPRTSVFCGAPIKNQRKRAVISPARQ